MARGRNLAESESESGIKSGNGLLTGLTGLVVMPVQMLAGLIRDLGLASRQRRVFSLSSCINFSSLVICFSN